MYPLGREAEERKRMTEDQIGLHHLDRERDVIIRYDDKHHHVLAALTRCSVLILLASFSHFDALFPIYLNPLVHLLLSPFDVIFL